MTFRQTHHLINTGVILLILILLIPTNPAHAQTPPATPIPATGDFDGLIDIGNNRHLYLTCRGAGSATVLLEAGAGNNAQIWEHITLPPDATAEAVLPAIAQFTRVCAYGRPGTLLADIHHGRSDPVAGRRSAADMVADLHALIDAAGMQTTLVLAGHSFGGLIVRLYADTYCDDVAGLVLIDSAHEDDYAGLQSLLTPQQWAAANELPGREAYPELELIDVVTSAAQVIAAEATTPVRQMPVIVLTHGQDFGFPPPIPPRKSSSSGEPPRNNWPHSYPAPASSSQPRAATTSRSTKPSWSPTPSTASSTPSAIPPLG